MPVKEPTKQLSPDTKCEAALKQIARIAADMANTARDAPMTARGAVRIAAETLTAPFMQAHNWVRRLGPGGEALSEAMLRVAKWHARIRGEWDLALKDSDQYSVADQTAAFTVLHDGKSPKFLNDDASAAYDILKPTFDDAFKLAELYEAQRLVDGEYKPIMGTGRLGPSILSAQGRRIAKNGAENRRGKDVRKAAIDITMMNHPDIVEGLKGFDDAQLAQVTQVAHGHVDEDMMSAEVIAAGEAIAREVDWGFEKLALINDETVRGVVGYFERTRMDLPDYMRELNPQLALPMFYNKTALMLSAWRDWGFDMKLLVSQISVIRVENGDAAANMVGNYIFSQLSRPSGTALLGLRKAASAMQTYQMLRLFGLTFVGPMRNYPQTITNAVDQPFSSIWRTYKELPPFMRTVAKLANDNYRNVIKAGAVAPFTPTTEALTGFARKLAFVHTGIVDGNQVRSGVQGYYAMVENLSRVLKWEPHTVQLEGFATKEVAARNRVQRMYDIIRHLQVKPQEAHLRALERSGVDMEEVERLRRRVRPMTDAERQELLDKPEELFTEADKDSAMYESSINNQFGYNFANKRIVNGPVWNSILTVKGWGTRMGGYIYKDVMTELLKYGNAKPLVKLMATTFLLGEFYNLVRDGLTGQERSMINRARSGALTDDDDTIDWKAVGLTTIRNIGDGGGLFLLMDVLYGAESFFGGPVGGTAMNGFRAIQHVAVDPSPQQALDAWKDFMDKEFVMTNQWKGGLGRIGRGFDEKFERRFAYNRWRERSYRYLDQRDDPTFGTDIGRLVERFVSGGRNLPTKRSLAYEDASEAIIGNRITDAQKDFRDLLRLAKDSDERESMLSGIRTAGRQRSPLGVVPVNERETYLAQYSIEDYREAADLQRSWMADWNTASASAENETRGSYRGGN